MYHAIIQARMGSKRLPGKSLMKYNGVSPLEVLIKRVKKIKEIELIIVATTKLKEDDIFSTICKKLKVKLFRGKTNNVLDRYYNASKFYESKNIIRLTADCPFVDSGILKKLIKIFESNNYDYVSNTYPLPCTYPDGSDIEIFSFKSLAKIRSLVELPSDKEHVTKFFFKRNNFRCFRLDSKKNLSKYRYTIDIDEDFNLYKSIIKNKNFLKIDMMDIIKFIKKNPKLVDYQKKIKRNFGWESSLKKDKKFKKNKLI